MCIPYRVPVCRRALFLKIQDCLGFEVVTAVSIHLWLAPSLSSAESLGRANNAPLPTQALLLLLMRLHARSVLVPVQLRLPASRH